MSDELMSGRIDELRSVLVVDKEMIFRIEAVHGLRATPGLSNIFQAGSLAEAADQTNRARSMNAPIQGVM